MYTEYYLPASECKIVEKWWYNQKFQRGFPESSHGSPPSYNKILPENDKEEKEIFKTTIPTVSPFLPVLVFIYCNDMQ